MLAKSYDDYLGLDGARTEATTGSPTQATTTAPTLDPAAAQPTPKAADPAPTTGPTSYQYQPPTTGDVAAPTPAPLVPPPPPPPVPTYETSPAEVLPGGVQTVTAPTPAPIAPGAVTPAGTPGIDGITRNYDYVEGRTNPDPVNTFATDPSLAGPGPTDTAYGDQGLIDMARRMAFMNEQSAAAQRSGGVYLGDGSEMPADYAYRGDAIYSPDGRLILGNGPATLGGTAAPTTAPIDTRTNPDVDAAAARLGLTRAPNGNPGIVPPTAPGMQGPTQRDALMAALLRSIFAASPSAGGPSAGASPAATTPMPTAAPFRSAEVVGIDPNDDLRDKMILPGQDQVLEDARQKMFGGLDRLTNYDRAGRVRSLADEYFGTLGGGTDTIDPTASARLDGYGHMLDDAAGKLALVDRFKLAQDRWKTFADETAPEYDLAMREATQRAAAAGASRSGMLRTKYGDLALQRTRDLDTEKRRLLNDALEGTIADQFNKTNTLSGLEQSLAARERADRTERRGERDRVTDLRKLATQFGMDLGDAESGDLTRGFDAARGVFGDVAGESRARRNELRTERGFQTGQEQQAYDRFVDDWSRKRTTQSDAFNRALALLSAGEYGNPSDTLARLAQDGGIDPQTIALLAASLGNRQGYGGGVNGNTGIVPQGGASGGGLTIPDLGNIDDVLAGIDWTKFPGAIPPTPEAYPTDPEF